mgnify:FL=1
MHGRHFLKRILWLELLGGFLLLLFLWVDEVLDLPHHLLGAPATPVNVRESLFESLILLVLGMAILGGSLWLARCLQKSLQQTDYLFSLISHDLRSPFTNLLGNSELLKESFSDLSVEDRITLIDGIHSSALRAYSQLDNLLQWVQLQRKETHPAPEVIDFRELVSSLMEDEKSHAKEKSVVLNNQLDLDCKVFADETELRSIVRNLLSNAIKFSFSQGEVTVSAQPRGQRLYIQVADQGPGISARKQRILMHRKSIRSTCGTSGEKGCGLGLMLVKEFVHRNGGKLIIRSTPGKGSEFIFSVSRAV